MRSNLFLHQVFLDTDEDLKPNIFKSQENLFSTQWNRTEKYKAILQMFWTVLELPQRLHVFHAEKMLFSNLQMH